MVTGGSHQDGRLRDRQRAFREAEIVRTASELMSEHGCRSMTVDDVARRLGISKATLYTHFRSKDELIESALEVGSREHLEGIPDADVDPRERFRRTARHFAEALLGLSGDHPVSCCCLAEVDCPYSSYARVDGVLSGMADEAGLNRADRIPPGVVLRVLCAAVWSLRKRDGQTPAREDVDAVLAYMLE